MSGPEWALQGAIRAALAGDDGVKAWLGDPARIHDEPPDDPVFPFATFGRSESRPLGADADAATTTEHALYLHVWSRYGGRREAKEAADALRAVLHEAALVLDGHDLVSLRVTYVDALRVGDGRTTRAHRTAISLEHVATMRARCGVSSPARGGSVREAGEGGGLDARCSPLRRPCGRHFPRKRGKKPNARICERKTDSNSMRRS